MNSAVRPDRGWPSSPTSTPGRAEVSRDTAGAAGSGPLATTNWLTVPRPSAQAASRSGDAADVARVNGRGDRAVSAEFLPHPHRALGGADVGVALRRLGEHAGVVLRVERRVARSEEHTSELQSLA